MLKVEPKNFLHAKYDTFDLYGLLLFIYLSRSFFCLYFFGSHFLFFLLQISFGPLIIFNSLLFSLLFFLFRFFFFPFEELYFFLLFFLKNILNVNIEQTTNMFQPNALALYNMLKALTNSKIRQNLLKYWVYFITLCHGWPCTYLFLSNSVGNLLLNSLCFFHFSSFHCPFIINFSLDFV